MGRTCGEPNEIDLNPMGVKLNGPHRVPVRDSLLLEPRDVLCLLKSRNRAVIFFGLVFFFDSVWLTTRTMHPHGAYKYAGSQTESN